MAVGATSPELTECWELIYQVCDDEERDRLSLVLGEHIEALDICRAPFGCLGSGWNKKMESALPSDCIAWQLIVAAKRLNMPATDFLPTIETLYQTLAPRTATTHDEVLRILEGERLGGSEFAKAINNSRDAAFAKAKSSREALPEPEPDVSGWVY